MLRPVKFATQFSYPVWAL